MQLPGWLKVVKTLRSEGGFEMVVRVRKWHPGYWWVLLKAWLGALKCLQIGRKP